MRSPWRYLADRIIPAHSLILTELRDSHWSKWHGTWLQRLDLSNYVSLVPADVPLRNRVFWEGK